MGSFQWRQDLHGIIAEKRYSHEKVDKEYEIGRFWSISGSIGMVPNMWKRSFEPSLDIGVILTDGQINRRLDML